MDESRFVPAPASSEPPEVSELRCSDCHQLRRSLPRHAPGCRYAGQNCPGCADAGDAHLASCPIATQLKLPTDTCCEGVDLPTVGHVHSPDCRNPRRVLRASHTLPSAADLDRAAEELAVTEATKADAAEDGRERRDALLARLIFAAREMAQARMAESWNPGDKSIEPYCLECGWKQPRPHAKDCRTGRVLQVIADLVADAEAHLNPQSTVVVGGDAAQLPEFVPGRPGSIVRECQKCGALNDEWAAQQMPDVEVQLDLLGLNQCVGAGIAGKGHTLYTHRCSVQPREGGAR